MKSMGRRVGTGLVLAGLLTGASEAFPEAAGTGNITGTFTAITDNNNDGKPDPGTEPSTVSISPPGFFERNVRHYVSRDRNGNVIDEGLVIGANPPYQWRSNETGEGGTITQSGPEFRWSNDVNGDHGPLRPSVR